jgi:hypothetical protein
MNAGPVGRLQFRYRGRRQAKFETSSTGAAFTQGEFAAMGADDFTGEAESEAKAFRRALTRAVAAIEA